MYSFQAELNRTQLAELLELKCSKIIQPWENGYRLIPAGNLHSTGNARRSTNYISALKILLIHS